MPSGRCLRPRGSKRGAGAGPGGAGAGAGGGEDDRAAAAGREDKVVAAQGDGFFGAQRRVVQAAEERGQLRPDPGDLVQDRPDLRRAGHGRRADGHGGFRCAPAHQADGVGGQQPELDGIAQGAVEHRPLAGDRVRRGGRAVQPRAQPVQGSPDDARVAELADRQGCLLHPGQRAGGARIGRPRSQRRVEGMPVQGSAQPHGRWHAAGVPGQQWRDGGQRVGQAGPANAVPGAAISSPRTPPRAGTRSPAPAPVRSMTQAPRWPGRTRRPCGLRGPARRGSCRPAPGS